MLARRLLLLAVLPGLATCAPDEPGVEFFCAQLAQCGCELEDLATEPACNQRLRDGEATLREYAAERGLVFDAACWRTRLQEVVDHLGCASFRDPRVDSLPFTSCGAVHGSGELDAPCQAFNDTISSLPPLQFVTNVSDCRAELDCVEGRCAPRTPSRGVGEQCLLDGGDTLAVYPCAEGLLCNALGLCAMAAGDGELCGAGEPCDEGLDCELSTGRCHPGPPAGEPCTRICGEGLLCELGVCVEAPRPGEPCDGACIDGACESGVCERDGAALCTKAPELYFHR